MAALGVLAVGLATPHAGAAPIKACIEALGPVGQTLCAAPGVGGDWRALEAAGAPSSKLATATAACAPRAAAIRPAQERQAYACARAALWRAARVERAKSDPATQTGRYIARGPGFFGELTVLDQSDGNVRLRLRAERTSPGRASANTCRLELDTAWRTRREIAWKGALVAGAPQSTCDIAARPTGEGLLVESDARCAWACGSAVDYQATYRLER